MDSTSHLGKVLQPDGIACTFRLTICAKKTMPSDNDRDDHRLGHHRPDAENFDSVGRQAMMLNTVRAERLRPVNVPLHWQRERLIQPLLHVPERTASSAVPQTKQTPK